MRGAGFVASPHGNDLACKFAAVCRGGGLLVAGERKLVLRLAVDALRLGQKLCGEPHVQGALARGVKQLGVEIDARIHGDVVHVLQPADDLHVLGAGRDGVGRLVDRLQAAAAQAVDGGAPDARGQSGEQADDAADVEPLFALLLAAAEHHVLDGRGIDARAVD